MKNRLFSTVIAAALVVGCTSEPAALTDADRAAIRELMDQVVRHVAAEDNEAWANDFTEDGIFMFANTPVSRGRQAIQAWGESGPRVIDISFSNIEISGEGNLAWVTSAISVTVDGAPGPDTAKQLVVVERQADGAWLSVAAHVSSDLPLPQN